MKRKLISFDVFESIQNKSLSASEKELVEAAPILAKALGVDALELNCFGPETAMFETPAGEYVHTNYVFENSTIRFENIEQLAIDQETEKAKSRESLSLLVDALLDNKDGKDKIAKTHFETYMNLPLTRRTLREGMAHLTSKDATHKGGLPKGKSAKAHKNDIVGRRNAQLRKNKSGKTLKYKGEKDFVKKFAEKTSVKKMKEWHGIAGNVLDYVDFREYGPILKEAEVSRDKLANVSAVKLPISSARNAAKMLSFTWQTTDTDYKILRGKAKRMSENTEFCKAVNELRRHNALSDATAMEETVENIVGNWPDVLLLTQDEMAQTIKLSLESMKAANYDDDTCNFLAEGILRAAHQIYTDRVNKVVALSGGKVNEDAEDQYAEFKNLTDQFYPSLDESAKTEMQMYVDLYEALREVYGNALSSNDETVKTETASHLNELVAIVQRQVAPDLDVAEQAAEWLQVLTEAGLTAWEVFQKTYMTVNGDHPDLANHGRQNPTLASLGDMYGDKAAVSDGKNLSKELADEMRNDSWGNIAGAGTWPNLDNPYIPKPFGDWTMKGEKGVDKDLNAVLDGYKDQTWPSLKNPYTPGENRDISTMRK